MNKEEALLHAINELIERQTLSEHYFDTFILNKIPIKINKNSLTNNINEILIEVEKEMDMELEIIKLENNFNMYSYLVFPKNENMRKFYKGSGCSLSSEYALERAILECLQTYHLLDINEEKIILEKEKLYKEYKLKKYLDIFILNYKEYIEENYNFNDISLLDVPKMIKIIIDRLNELNYRVFESVLFKKNNIVCIKVIVPNFEHFNLVAEGIPILPNNNHFDDIIKIKEK